MAVASNPAKRPLSALGSVGETYRTTFGNAVTLGRVGWIWAVILIVIVAGVHGLVFQFESWRDDISLALSFTVPVFVASAVAVSWHRFVLLGETTSGFDAIRLNSTVLRYFLWALAFIVVPSIAIALLFFGLMESSYGFPGLIDTMLNLEPAWVSLAIATILVFCLAVLWPLAWVYIVMRLALILPAIALHHHGVTAGEAWRRSRGYGWKLLLGAVLTGLPVLVVSIALLAAFEGSEGLLPYVVQNVLYEFINLVGGILGVTFLSIAYRHLFADRLATGAA